ncbi:MAG TPA: hypothetical protein VEY67_01830 [Candidatus Dormibacteraeota bacterium]|nr:hypothetical protein [Candidatus Dormibacteraeota bacterium]
MARFALLALVDAAVAASPGTGPWKRAGAISGQGVVEYGIILGLSALLALVILVVFGGQVADIVAWIGQTVDAAKGGR